VFVFSKVATSEGSPTTIQLEYKGFHQFSLCQNLNNDPFEATQLGFMPYFESGIFPRSKTNSRNKEKQPILFVAALHGQEKVVEWLLANGVDVNGVEGKGGHAACYSKRKAVTEKLLQCGVDHAIKNKSGLTAKEENSSFYATLQPRIS